MFDVSSNTTSSTSTAKISMVEFNSNECVIGTSLPLLQRNVRCRYRKLENRAIKDPYGAINESSSMSKEIFTTKEPAMVDVKSLKKAPFLIRNLRIPHISNVASRHRNATKRKCNTLGDSMKIRQQYRVHCIQYECNETMKKNTTMTSFMLPAYHCPFCVSCESVDFESLWFHCTVIHGEDTIFHPIQTTNQEHHLLVEKTQQLQLPVDTLEKTAVLFYRRSRSAHVGSIKPSPTFHKKFRKRFPLPVRTYYHDETFHPISLTEWLCDNMISGDYYEREHDWRRIVDTSALYDLTDVSEKEKLLMVMWNEYMRNHPIIAAVQLPPQLKSFVHEHSAAIFRNQLEDELIKHLTNMWVEGHIGREDMLDNMQSYNSLVEGRHYRSYRYMDQT